MQKKTIERRIKAFNNFIKQYENLIRKNSYPPYIFLLFILFYENTPYPDISISFYGQ